MTSPSSIAGARTPRLSPQALEFAPSLLSIQESPPAPFPRTMLYALTTLTAILILWACVGKLDIIASADGRLVPKSYVKIVQPAEPGIVREILVHEGEAVTIGQVLLRMDRQEAEADLATTVAALATRNLQLRRIDAELSGRPLARNPDDSDDLFRHVDAQLTDRRQAYQDSLAQAQESLRKAEHERESGLEMLDKLKKTNPIYQKQAESYADLGHDGYAPQVLVNDKQREYVENTQELKAQEAQVAGLSSAVAQADKQVRQITSKYRADLQNERIDAAADRSKLDQDMAKHTHQTGLLELRASEAGIVKDLATHTIGTVVSAGTVLLSLVPENEPVVAEVVVRNEDVAFVRPDQLVKVKVASYPFQKYGMLEGKVRQVWPDSTDGDGRSKSRDGSESSPDDREGAPAGYKALIDLTSQTLSLSGNQLRLVPGMRVVAEINQGRRSVLEYLLSPVQRVAQEGGRER